MLDLIPFVAITAAFVVMPGPNVLVIVATSIRLGRKHGMLTVAGTSLAMLIQLVIAGVSAYGFISAVSEGLVWLKWLGILYLAYLGFTSLKRAFKVASTAGPIRTRSFQQGFFVSLSNPKTLAFFVAFLPQFINATGNYNEQIFVLSLVFWSIAVTIDSAYVLVSTWVSRQIDKAQIEHWLEGISGGLYLTASTLLAASHK